MSEANTGEIEQSDAQPIIPYQYTEHKRRKQKRHARTLRTILGKRFKIDFN